MSKVLLNNMKNFFIVGQFILIFGVLTSIFSPNQGNAASLYFDFEHNCAAIPTACHPIGALYFGVDIPNSLPPSASVPITFSGAAIEPLIAVPICPTIRYGGNGPASVPSFFSSIMNIDGTNCFGKNSILDNILVVPRYFTTPATPGTYSFCGAGGTEHVQYMAISNLIVCDNYTVVSLPTGTMNVSANNPAATWTISGPVTVTGSGSSQNYPSQQTGNYTITWGAVPGFTTPAPQSRTLATGGTITFNGTYTAITPPSVQLNFQ